MFDRRNHKIPSNIGFVHRNYQNAYLVRLSPTISVTMQTLEKHIASSL
jgi:hypothetical protein